MLVVTAKIEMVYLDASGSTKALTLSTRSSNTVSTIASEVAALGAIVASITSCVFVRQRIKYTVWEDAPIPAAVGSSIKRRAVLFLGTGDINPLAVIEIPSPIDSIFLTDGPSAFYEVDVTNTDVIAFVDTLVAENATNVFGDAIEDVQSGYLQSRV